MTTPWEPEDDQPYTIPSDAGGEPGQGETWTAVPSQDGTEPEPAAPPTEPDHSFKIDEAALPPGQAAGDATVHWPAHGQAGFGSIDIGLELPGFEVIEVLGRGGMGIVYKAWEHHLQRLVALKVLPPPFSTDPVRMARFRHEAKVVAGLVEKGILPVHAIHETPAGPVLVLPFIDGCDLGKILRARQAFLEGLGLDHPHVRAGPPWSTLPDREYLDRIMPIVDQIVDAVAALHEAEVLHRDIKPSNVLIDGRDNVRLGDFGLARLGLNPDGDSPPSVFGTPGYMAPEQRQGRPDVDARADVFGLGATIYHVLTLELPYGSTTLPEQAAPPEPPHMRQRALGADFGAVVLKAVEQDRRDRYRSIAEFRDDWRRVRAGLTPRARPVGPAVRLLRWGRRRPWVVTTAVLALLLLGVPITRLVQYLNGPDRPRIVQLPTSPPCDRFVFVRLDDTTGEARRENAWYSGGTSPVSIKVPPGRYLVEVGWPDGRFHEVYRQVPGPDPKSLPSIHSSERWDLRSDGTVVLPTIAAPPSGVTEGMALFTSGPEVRAFYLDPAELTLGQYREIRGGAPVDMVDSVRLKAVVTDPVNFIKQEDAVEIAETLGKRLPTREEYLHAVQSLPSAASVGEDRTATSPPVLGLRSGLKEWTTSWYVAWLNGPPPLEEMATKPSHYVVIEGGTPLPAPPAELASMFKGPLPPDQQQGILATADVGMRCARSARPRFLPAGPQRR